MSNRTLCVAGESSQKIVSYFSVSRVFYGAPRASVFLTEGKSRALICLHTFTFILLAIVYASYLSFQNVFLTLNNYLHLKRARRQCLAPNMRKIWKMNLWMEQQSAQLRFSIQVVGFRRIYLLNGSIILFTSLSPRQMILSCWLLMGINQTPKIWMWWIKPGNTVLSLSVYHHILSRKFNHLMLVSWSH